MSVCVGGVVEKNKRTENCRFRRNPLPNPPSPSALNSQLIRSTQSHPHTPTMFVVYQYRCDVNAVMRPMFAINCVLIRIPCGKSESLEMEGKWKLSGIQSRVTHPLPIITVTDNVTHPSPTRLTKKIPKRVSRSPSVAALSVLYSALTNKEGNVSRLPQ